MGVSGHDSRTFLVDGSLSDADVDLVVDDRVAVRNRLVFQVGPKLLDHFQEFPVGPRFVHVRLLLPEVKGHGQRSRSGKVGRKENEEGK